MESGDIEELFGIIPRIGVLRDSRFKERLVRILFEKNVKRREFAAFAMGAMRNQEFLEPLKKAYHEAAAMRGRGAEELQVAVIEAIGSIGNDASVDFFLPILQASAACKSGRRMCKWIVESLGTIAQQGGARSLNALVELTRHQDPELQAQALSELSVAYWHRPNEVAEDTLHRMYILTRDRNPLVAESALAALQSLADVGCRRAERLFAKNS